MKTTTLILMLLISAQITAGPRGGDNGLNLTETQKEQMAAVKERTQARMHEAKTEIHAQAKAEMAEFLTADQLAAVEERMAHRQEHAKLRKEHKQMKRERRQQKRLNRDLNN